jgi:hypothetical protein
MLNYAIGVDIGPIVQKRKIQKYKGRAGEEDILYVPGKIIYKTCHQSWCKCDIIKSTGVQECAPGG